MAGGGGEGSGGEAGHEGEAHRGACQAGCEACDTRPPEDDARGGAEDDHGDVAGPVDRRTQRMRQRIDGHPFQAATGDHDLPAQSLDINTVNACVLQFLFQKSSTPAVVQW